MNSSVVKIPTEIPDLKENDSSSEENHSHLVNLNMFNEFSNEIRKCFPTFVASVVADRHGFIIHADTKVELDENLLALSAICKTRKFLDLSNYHKIYRRLSKNVKLMVLLDKSRENFLRYGKFEDVVNHKNPV